MNFKLHGKLRLSMLRTFLVLTLMLLSGCATNTVFLHTYEIKKEEIDKIVKSLQEKEFEVVVSERIPPMLQLGSFVIYPRESGDNEPLVKIFDAIGEHGYYTYLIAKNRVKNHSYTKKTNIGLYLINPNIDWLNAQQQLDIGFAFNLTDVTFSSTNCMQVFSLDFEKGNTGVIRQTLPKSNDMRAVQWQQDEEQVAITYGDKTYDFAFEKDYIRSGNRNDLLLTLSPGNSVALGLTEPFSCKFVSRVPLVD